MKLRVVLALVTVLAASVADAKLLRDVKGPAEIPPASFTGKQYVDSDGCVFVRAGVDGVVKWIPRVARDRSVMCGQIPSLAGAKSAPPPPKTTAPTATTPTATTTVLAAPIAPVMGVTRTSTARTQVAAAETTGAVRAGLPPKGYRPAWRDGRLNPRRGPGAVAAAEQPLAATTVTAVPHGRYVQVGVFADAGNSERTAARLQAMGLPVVRQPISARGTAAMSIAAGPIAPADLSRVLSGIRSAGFADAFIR